MRTAVFDVTDGPSVAAGIADVKERVGPLRPGRAESGTAGRRRTGRAPSRRTEACGYGPG
ncbi:hypothetical protein AVL59_35030 [Streptomyces griseochromogenes]|uniref:Uncharacterized protein n=1 Tax=Streptomyces griseochromogenes TaxID=68214 RepID=A0A1B1B5P5_9ACTN|nr:hypothetical protein AVL59_35030 [Streptomyces griseochromogenes]